MQGPVLQLLGNILPIPLHGHPSRLPIQEIGMTSAQVGVMEGTRGASSAPTPPPPPPPSTGLGNGKGTSISQWLPTWNCGWAGPVGSMVGWLAGRLADAWSPPGLHLPTLGI